MAREHHVTLPGGVWEDGGRRRDAVLRPLDGEDEAFVVEKAAALTPAERTTALLARCLLCLGVREPVSREDVRALATGDRQALLLHLRRASFGERLECVLACPACEEALDVDLAVGDLLLPPYPDRPPLVEAEVGGAAVRFRLPTGADEEAAARAAADGDGEGAAALVLERCLAEPAELGAEDAAALDALLGELDPQADVVLELVCAACGAEISAPFDPGDYLARELGGSGGGLLREIHLLALHYGWQESELRAMTPQRRRRYVEHLVEALAP